MQKLFPDFPEAISNTAELSSRLEFTLKDLGYEFPKYPVSEGETMMSFLRERTREGFQQHYGRATADLRNRARQQVERELHLIEKLKLEGYFLIVWDLVRFCREQKILVQGRGSAANSAACYSLGITAIDPVGMDLLFERFLSEERGEWPDIDLDLPSGDQRERVIQYLYKRYGERGAAMTANVITYRSRMAGREMGKALGFDPETLDKVSAAVSTWEYRDSNDTFDHRFRDAGLDINHPRLRKYFELCVAAQDLPRHLGQHSGGMVICQGQLDSVVPLEPASMPGRVVVQWDKDDCHDLGIIKVDLLGLGMMAVLEDSIQLIRDNYGEEIDLAHLPQDDPTVYSALQKADTIGMFQIESRAQMSCLPRLRPRHFYDIVVQVAIIRPGPIVGQMVNPFLQRRMGREAVTYAHPSLEPVLSRTLGVPLFQEQLLRIAMIAAGFTGSEAEELRRAFGFKRSERRMAEVEVKLREGMARRGITGRAADEIVHQITSFALYGFPECVVGDTRVLDADSGRWVRIEDVVNGVDRVEATLACDEGRTLRRRRVLRATASGRRGVYRLTTLGGRTIVATAEHLLLTPQGWRPLAALRERDRVAGARRGGGSAELVDSSVGWDRVVLVERAGVRDTYDLEIEGDHNFLAHDLVVHNSHSSSFALLAYASAYLKAHHGPAFYAALLNNQPMGFYHSATVVNDARRHGVRVLPVDVTRSNWPCTLEQREGVWVVRLGLRFVKGLRERAGQALVAAR